MEKSACEDKEEKRWQIECEMEKPDHWIIQIKERRNSCFTWKYTFWNITQRYKVKNVNESFKNKTCRLCFEKGKIHAEEEEIKEEIKK